MPIPTPFHSRTAALCTSMRWKDWAGYHAVCAYDSYHEREYFAIRHAAGLIDVTPLHKYEVCGRDAAAFLARLMVRDVSKLPAGRVAYLCWCDEHGKIIDDGTVSRFDDARFRVTSTEPALAWLLRHADGYELTIEDSSATIAALALQGPNARDILQEISDGEIGSLRWFGTTEARIRGGRTGRMRIKARISRTGYTGDLGYEIWVDNKRATALWDALLAAGKRYGLQPAGLDALDMTRIEAGFILNGVDYFPAQRCLIESRKSSPYELGLGWTVNLDREPFNGQAALRAERQRGSAWALVGLEYDWDELEALYAEHGLPAEICSSAWRRAVPVYEPTADTQVGYATSGTWSPLIKKNIALASVHARFGQIGTRLEIETTVEFVRRRVTATVVRKPFFDPERKRA